MKEQTWLAAPSSKRPGVSGSLEEPGNSRLHKILAMIRRNGRVGVKELSEAFGVSEVTVRNDLNDLANQGLITRTFGGAIDFPSARWKQDSAAHDSGGEAARSLSHLGKAAAHLLLEGDVAYIDSSEETRSMVPYLRNLKRVKVITSSLHVALELARSSDLEVILLGGRVTGKTPAVAADFESNPVLTQTNIAKAFIGAWGLSPDEGLTDLDSLEASLKREVVGRAKEVVALLRPECWNRVSSSTFARIEDVDIVVTEKEASHEMVDFCRAAAAKVVRESREAVAGKGLGHYPYFKGLRVYARKHLVYPDAPGAGRSLAFCNGCRAQSFSGRLEKSILEQAHLAGFSRSAVVILDNDFSAEKALENADEILKRKPDVFVQFQVDMKINHVIAERFEQAGIPTIAVDVPIPGAPFIGVNNWKVAVMAGEYASAQIKSRWGSSPAIDLVLLLQIPVCGDINMLRTEGFADTLIDEFGDAVQNRIARVDCGMGKTEESELAVSRILDSYPQARRIVITALDEELIEIAIRALKSMNRWNREDLILVTYGCNALGQNQLRQNLIDAAVAIFPERYGEYVIPAACSLLAQEPVPSYTYVQSRLMTKDNIGEYYP